MSYYNSSGHICGLYYTIPGNYYGASKVYLPQVELQAHATILSTTSRTVLKQSFVNPSTNKGIREVRYTFPLYDGVSVVGFVCHVGDRTIVGEVKEKEKARAVFKDAVAKGQTAGLFEQLPDASDVFTTTVGNIPPGAKVIVEITYLGELKHDMEVDGIRFTIPNIICPRYGSYPTSLQWSPAAQQAVGNGISITVDADMADGSFIQKIQSPTHPIAMTMGTTSLAPDADPTMTKASATLTLGTAELDKDFIVQIIAKNTGVPKAVLETHPSIPNHKALMATLVPKFALPPEKPELVFVCDRSGSMDGSNIKLVIQALKVFLKSLSVGVKFNICSFGSSHSFLWPKSVTYSQSTLDEAIRHVGTFNANFGGTEMLQPIKATIKQRYNDMPLDVMLLTDGEIWNQTELFSYLNESVQDSKAPIRVFTLGIGNGVSHALIEGVARAGNGFSQTVGDGEKMDTKVVRMLKGALSPHINDYTLEVKYADASVDGQDDDFELVEKVRDSLKVNLTIGDTATKPTTKKPISLFDTSANPDKEDATEPDDTGEGKYAHLPNIAVPKIIQAPQNIPSLFAFNRTTVYLLLGPDAPTGKPTSVILRGTSAHGPLELEIPVQSLEQVGDTVHQLAAKKAISELEQGRGWLSQAKDDTETFLKKRFEGRFDDMVEREAVRLGVQFQVGGKWCSFVAVESNKKEKEKQPENWEWIEDEAKTQNDGPDANSFGLAILPADRPGEDSDVVQLATVERRSAAVKRRSAPLKNVFASRKRGKRHQFIDVEAEVDEEDDEAGGEEKEEEDDCDDPESDEFMNDTADCSEEEDSESEPPFKYLASVDQKTTALSTGGTDAPDAPQDGSPTLKAMPNGVFSMCEISLTGPEANIDFLGPRMSYSHGSAAQQYVPPPPGKVASFFGSPYTSHMMPTHNSTALQSTASWNTSPNQALQDHQMGLMLLEQQNKKRLLMARQDSDTNTARSGYNTVQTHKHSVGGSRTGLTTLHQEQPQSMQMQQQAAMQMQQQQQAMMPTHVHQQQQAMMQMHMHQQQQAMMQAAMPQAVSPAPPGGPPQPAPSFGGPPSTAASLAAPPPPPLSSARTSASGPLLSGSEVNMDLGLDFGDNTALENFDFDSFLQQPAEDGFGSAGAHFDFSSVPTTVVRTPEELTHYLISLQTFEGSWELSADLAGALKIAETEVDKMCAAQKVKPTVFVTALVVASFERTLKDFAGSWELVVEKAKGWLAEQGVSDGEEVLRKVGLLVNSALDLSAIAEVSQL